MTPEIEHLRVALDGLRAIVLKKLAGLSEDDARRSTVGSGTNVAGLVQHLTFAEWKWFGDDPGRSERSMTVDPAVSLRTVRAAYREACEAANAFIAVTGDGDAPLTRNGRATTLRAVLVGMIEETARHAGHADIIREQLDGRTGR
ncbi:DinB family protein [Actinoplanes sp. NBRC 103695]|uniref:DinB family protein n=1 Tax=Actinoplanes sp. NBRC 103695 TaxID=3032202 RepID=UPI0024A35DB4|nr:DinB family protein [Actinoplanes sp. NBRC 103695]GLZ02230.1 hypothetical protein Acsp02_94810 [Actinoplanes sp. NBRC 103695]